ncbi:hypothetical protein DCAR_0623170 [Daucus carota subsp. sativus]|uniref:TTF-type domain-containing protein n=1 Tax=Daucus carota subsp. sativus TaxID=79200 RepID=A0AAF1B2K7_DAUCS|nr:hypothetical protein DCAR_0623170 [Daucus carota subsp. sativus]
MDKFVIRTKRPRSPCSVNKNSGVKSGAEAKTDSGSNASVPIPNVPIEERASTEFNSEELISDTGLRIPIAEYNVNIRDQVRRAYIAKGPFQITNYNFPKKQFNKEMKSFQANWFKEFDWLEYSVAKDEAYCLWCYLFKPDREENTGKNAFTTAGFNNWKKVLVVFRAHVGSVGSSHNKPTRHCQAFKNQRQSISHIFSAQGHEIEVDYRKRLTAVLNVIRLLLRQAFAFRGHDISLLPPYFPFQRVHYLICNHYIV